MVGRRWLLPILAAIAAAFGAAVVSAVALAVLDIYLAGHGQAILGRAWIDRPFIHMSRADCILVLGSLASALTAGWTTRRLGQSETRRP